MTGRRPVPTLGAVTRMPMLRPRVAKTVAVHMPEIPCLARQDRLVARSALLEAGCDCGGWRLSLSAVRLGVSGAIGLSLPASLSCFPLRHRWGEKSIAGVDGGMST